MRAAPRDRGRGPSRIVFPGGCFGRTRPGGMEEMVVPLDDVNDIRAMDAAGVPRAEIARRLGLSRNTVAKYADMADMSPAAPEARVRRRRALSREDAAWVDAVLEADLGAPRKQRHSARRIYDRLVAERGCGDSCSTEVSTDMRSSYSAPLSEVGAASHNRYGEADAGEDELGMVNTLHERLRGFLWRFRGVSTRRLQRYLWWCVLLGGAGQTVGRLAGGDASLPRGERLVRVDAPGPRGGAAAVLGLLGVTGRVRRIQLGLIAVCRKPPQRCLPLCGGSCVLDCTVLLEEFGDVGSLDLLEHFFESNPLNHRQLHAGDGLTVA